MQLLDWRWLGMSREAIAAVLARADLASGERLVALSLASFADRANRAWPGAPAASARAGLSRSRYQQAREQLVVRGLVVVDARATGRGRSSTVTLAFADAGPGWDGEINVELFEGVLAYSRARGPERLLLATMAAVADDEGAVRDLSTEQLCAAAGVADRTYRRARTSLLASGQLELVSGVGGRGNTNVWTVRDPRVTGEVLPRPAPRRVARAGRRAPSRGAGVSRARSACGRTLDGRRLKGRSRSDSSVRKVSDPDRGSRVKGRSRSDTFGRQLSGPDRGLGPKGGSGSDPFRPWAAGNPGENPGRNPGA
jgi:hypothetical protein